MALMKMLRGGETRLDQQELHDGYIYFCEDTKNMWIDHQDTNGSLVRSKISAEYADKLRYIKDGDSVELTPEEIVAAISCTVVMADIDESATEFSQNWLLGITPDENKLYIVKNNNTLYRWNGSAYVQISIGIATKETYQVVADKETSVFTIPADTYDPDTDTLNLIQDNIVLVENENYTLSENTVTLIGYTLSAGESIYCIITHTSCNIGELQNRLGINNKANKPTINGTIVYAANWSNNIYSFENTYPFATYNIEIELNGDTCTVEQMNAWSDAKILGSATSNTIKAMGNVPAIDIPIIVKVAQK